MLFEKVVCFGLDKKSEINIIEKRKLPAIVLLCAILLTIFFFAKYLAIDSMIIRKKLTYTISSDEDGIEDAANSLEKNVVALSKLDPNKGWNMLSLEEKVDILSIVVKVECRHLGMRDSAPTLTIANLPDGTDGTYDYMTDNITLSYDSMVRYNSSGYKVAEALCEGMFYRYQSYMADIPRDDAKLMPLVGAVRYEPVYDRISEELAEKEYGKERIKDYHTAIWRYQAGINE